MTTTSAPSRVPEVRPEAGRRGPPPEPRRRALAVRSGLRGHLVGLVALAAVLMRLPFLGHSLGADEAGYLMVGRQWQPGGTSLYGNYWVDRPPLLVTLFRLAAETGGMVPLRLLGCLATALVVLGVGHVARRTGGDRASTAAAVAAAALCVSPLLDALEVNGELLAAPFVVWGIAAVLAAMRQDTGRKALWAAAAAGAALVAAMLVKQNMADAGVFAAVIVVVAQRRGEITARHARRIVLVLAGGAAGCLAVAAGWTLLHGTSLGGVFDAMYPFRVQASRAMAASHNAAPAARMWLLLTRWLVSGGGVVMMVAAGALATRRLRGTAVWALAATIAFESVSVMLGGNYWGHYLVQPAGPVAVVAGLLVARRLPGMRVLLTAMVVLAAVAWVTALPARTTSVASAVGHSIAAAAHRRDTIVTVYGHANLSGTTGLASPYPYLWSLPIKTLDPRLQRLDQVLRGPTAPTWFVTWGRVSSWGLESTTAAGVVAQHYHPVADLLGRKVYLHDGVVRPTPTVRAPTTYRSPLVSTLKEILP